MSSIEYDYHFYFINKDRAQALKAQFSDVDDEEEILKSLGLYDALDDAFVEGLGFGDRHLWFTVTEGTSSDINYALVRASKDMGSEYCHISGFNDQVGEGFDLHLFKGKPVTGSQLLALQDEYLATEKFRQYISSGDHAALNKALKGGLDPNLKIDGSCLALIAIANENVQALSLLIKHGADINVMNGDGDSLLIDVLKRSELGYYPCIALLVNNGADLNAIDADGGSVLWWASAFNKPLSNRLFKKGAKLLAPSGAYHADEDAMTRLYTAMQHSDRDQIKVLYPECVKSKKNWSDIASWSCELNQPSCLKPLVKNGFDVFVDGDGSESYDLLIESADSAAVYTCQYLIDLAFERGLDLSEIAQELMQSLAQFMDTEKLMTLLGSKYPECITYSSIVSAVESGRADNLKTLLAMQANAWQTPIDECDEDDEEEDEDYQRESILHETLCELTKETAQILLNCGASPAEVYDEQTVIERALEDGDVDPSVKKLFLEQSELLSPEQALAIFLRAGLVDKFKKVWLSMESKVTSLEDGTPLLNVAIQLGYEKIIDFLIEQKVDVNIGSESIHSPLVESIYTERSAIVRKLVEAGAHVNEVVRLVDTTDEEDEDNDEDALMERLLGKVVDMEGVSAFTTMMDIIVEPVGLEVEGCTPLMLAACLGNSTIVDVLIKHGADAKTLNKSGDQALFFAVMNNHHACFDLLLEAGCDVQLLNKENSSLVFLAAMRGLGEMIQKLIALKVDVNECQTTSYQSPLIVAVCGHSLHEEDVITPLLEQGAELNEKDLEGLTALMYACIAKDGPLITRLLEAGASVEIIDHSGKTAYEHFCEGNEGLETDGFSLDQLIPKSKTLLIRKGLLGVSRLLMKVIPAAFVVGGLAYFNTRYAMYLAIVIVCYWAFPLVWKLKSLLIKPKKKKPKIGIEMAFNAIGRAMEQNEENQERNKAIIASWDED